MNASLSIAILVFLLVHTNFVAEYANLFGFRSFLWRFWEWRKDEPHENLFVYWNDKYNNFITRLLSCGICLSTGFSLIYSLFIWKLSMFLLTAFWAVLGYFVLAVLYKLLNKLY